jgi:hypothetical protein
MLTDSAVRIIEFANTLIHQFLNVSDDTYFRLIYALKILFALPFTMLCIPFVSAGINWLWKHRRS